MNANSVKLWIGSHKDQLTIAGTSIASAVIGGVIAAVLQSKFEVFEQPSMIDAESVEISNEPAPSSGE